MLLAVSAHSQPGTLPLKPGDALPPLAGQTVTGKPLELPARSGGEVAVLIFSFSRAGGRDAQNWAQRLSKDEPHLPVYTVIFLESVPRLFRPMAVSAIRSGMPTAMLDRTLILYQRQNFWEEKLNITDESDACVLVLGQTGGIRWISSGRFAYSLYLRLREEVLLP
jgi:hypothetical protein